ncbi:ATP phosphoribosyltransferase regulatory subunit [Spirochaeta thermophila]|uniref:Histidine--tRNA ligase n=1 Tax=Winmispira thermophila (strain ATCC 49972 / DSM 6192 / RI 19.B1) TaxID=665571 RepID=E0RRW7_WINT6|nr:ATP phosphoribosyltransferase regulatory subunit [Spirochaeta thermophila]ADN01754.1 ATP phosphoribosyltransferase regulatory subunit [Spirochaeta thermophila DSM 6192]
MQRKNNHARPDLPLAQTTETARARLQIPRGTEQLLQEEALLHRFVVRTLEDLYLSQGYLPVQTPVFDFFDIYRPLLDPAVQAKTYRLVDREGDILMLRSDITLFLAKQLGTTVAPEDLPLRVFYADTILRHEGQEDISHDEYFQAGVELLGLPGPEGDLEILTLLAHTLSLFDLPPHTLHIGSKRLFSLAFSSLPDGLSSRIAHAIATRDRSLFTRILTQAGWDERDIENHRRLFWFIGEPGEIPTLTSLVRDLPTALGEEVAALASLVEALTSQGVPGSLLRIDLSETGGQDYYTGIAFRVYVEGADAAVVSGGRYDSLLSYFGLECPSVGYSLMLRKLEPLIRDPHRFIPPSILARIRKERI